MLETEPMKADTEITGPMAAKLFVSSSTTDADLFVIVRVFDPAGRELTFMGSTDPNTPIANGWLRASHRELDPVKSTEWQPVHPHTRAQKIKPGEIVPLDIEIWPSGTSFAAGEKLRLIVQGDDLNRYSTKIAPVYFRHKQSSVNKGRHLIHTGGQYES